MKRATRIPNRFIISIQSWPVKGLALFLVLLALGSCEDETSLIGTKKPISRFGIYFKEFDIPVSTIQSDSIRTAVGIGTTVIESSRLTCGIATDPNFGKISSVLYAQFSSATTASPKIDLTGKTAFVATGLSMEFVLDYYVYGDTTNSTQFYTVQAITDPTFFRDKAFYSDNGVSYTSFNGEIPSAGFVYKHDSVTKYRSLNIFHDTLRVSLPQAYAQALLDTATAKGVSVYNTETAAWKLSAYKTDSVFRRAFPGVALIPDAGNDRILGFSMSNSSMRLKYSYQQEGITVNASYLYSLYNFPGYSHITYDRTGTALAGVNSSNKYQDINAPDDYCYLQSGTGLFTKLDFSQVHSYFDANPDTIPHMALNDAELIVELEPDADRHHLSRPTALNFRVMKTSNRFFEVPFSEVTGSFDTQFANAYYCTVGEDLDALQDNYILGAVKLRYARNTDTNRETYSSYVTGFFSSFLKLPTGYNKIYYMGLLPADAPFGKSFHGLSFKKDKVKLRVYYTKTL